MAVRQVTRLLCLGMAVAMLATVAHAQPPGGGRGQRGGPGGGPGGGPPGGMRGGFAFGGGRGGFSMDRASLLRSPQVREELMIEEGQGATIDAAMQAFREDNQGERPDFSAIREMSEEERTAFFEKMQSQREKLSKETDDMLTTLLESDQVARLDQIVLQMKIRAALTQTLKSDEMRKKLSITDEQIAKMDTAEEANNAKQQEFRDQMRAAFQGGGERPDFESMRADMEKMRASLQDNVMAALTADQKSSLEKMQGKPFELDMRSMMRGGGRGRDAGGRGGRPGADGGRGGRPGGDGAGRGGRGGRPGGDDA